MGKFICTAPIESYGRSMEMQLLLYHLKISSGFIREEWNLFLQ